MKVGPVHVVTEATMTWMQSALNRLSTGLADSNQEIERLAKLLSATMAERDRLLTLMTDVGSHAHRLMHHPAFAKYPPNWVAEPDMEDARSLAAAERVVAAYQRASSKARAQDSGMWTHAERNNADFLRSLKDGDVQDVRRRLARLFRSSLINGLGRFHESMPEQIRAQPIGNRVQLQFTDVLVSLAEGASAGRVTSVEQDAEGHARSLDVCHDSLLHEIEIRTGLNLAFPEVCGAFGCLIAGKRVAIDSIVHSYTVHRLGQLGVEKTCRVAEIGGGYGCLSGLFGRRGIAEYSIYDLPWVNALQGYFLIMAFPETSIRLYGESTGKIAVLPFNEFFSLPSKCVDVVINTDSLPEIGPECARAYVRKIEQVAGRFFFSINQEAKAPVESFGPQLCVTELVREVSNMTCRSRQRYWMRPGYVEEVFIPESADH
jgi:hypothetical protein